MPVTLEFRLLEIPLPTAPINVVPPSIGGTAEVGETLEVDEGVWTGTEPITFTYQWVRVVTALGVVVTHDGEPVWVSIAGAMSSSYVPGGLDVGEFLLCIVTATNFMGTVTVLTAIVGPVV